VSTTPFEAKARQEPARAVLDLSGEINRMAEERMAAAYDEAVASDPKNVALDFHEVSYINSTGIAVIVGLLARARKEGRTVSALGLSDHYRHIFEITRLADFMTIVDDQTTEAETAARGAARG
jgi:anti-sigma B factor antagonist